MGPAAHANKGDGMRGDKTKRKGVRYGEWASYPRALRVAMPPRVR